jgi:hypothetical protein
LAPGQTVYTNQVVDIGKGVGRAALVGRNAQVAGRDDVVATGTGVYAGIVVQVERSRTLSAD